MGVCIVKRNRKKQLKKQSMAAGSKDRKEKLFFLVTVILMVIYLLWRIFFTLPLDQGIPQMIFAVLLILAECVTVSTTFELYYRKLKNDSGKLKMPVISPEEYPDVDVFIATHNEPCEVLYKTASACTFMDYPDKNKVHIYLCDDGCRPEVAQLAKDLGVGYLMAQDNKHAKSGNLNHALESTHSPLIATFDADMIPLHSFLMDTVPYFALPDYIDEDGIWCRRTEEEKEEKFKIGLIQTPQSFYNLDLFQFNLYSEEQIPNEQDFFSMEVNQMRNSSNACAYTGSNTMILRAAMEEIGGFPYHTITEDFETSCRLQMAGYITYATDKVEAHGLSTTDIRSMMRQRVRWARGVIQSLQNTHAIFSTKLPFSARITYLNSFLYWWSFFNRLIFILAPIMFALFDFQVVNCTLKELLIFWLPSYFFYSQSMRMLSSNIRSQKWSQIIDTTFAPSLVIPVLLETLHIRETKFKVTNKKKTTNNSRAVGYMIPHLVLVVLSVLAIIRFVHGKYGIALIYSAVIIYWLCHNLISLLYALAFMLGRDMPRKSERIAAQEKAVLRWDGGEMLCRTDNVSDGGVCLIAPGQLPQDVTAFTLKISTDRYEADLKAARVNETRLEKNSRFLHEDERDDEHHLCTFTVEPVDEHAHRQYVQVVYDRSTAIPRELDMWNTTFDDLLRILTRRFQNLLHIFHSKNGRHAEDAEHRRRRRVGKHAAVHS